MPATPETRTADFGVRPRRDVWQQLRTQTKLESDIDLAARMGLERTAIYRVLTGVADPSMKFVAHALRAFPFTTFERLFEWYAK